ncbi:MAG: amidohydrolase family protein [Betaproteobacteria bacterium]|nr:amidohydrolase family protein [Betaproteobacteria bacterium]MBL8534984.1 amidohydrolase family protein [Betaproteobacteria bacterium]
MSERPAGWLSDKELEEVLPADKAAFRSPIPTQIVSNGEYNPPPQTAQQRQVEGLINEYSDKYAKYHGVDRRSFLKSASGFAAAFLAMNQVFGPVFNVSEVEAKDRDFANERSRQLANQFIFDDQTHFVRDDFDKEGLLGLGKYAVERWNPAMAKTPMTLARYKFENYLKEIFMDSDTKVALLSSAPFDDPSWYLLYNDQLRDARSVVNTISGSRRLLSHSVFTPGTPGWMDEVEKSIAEYQPDSWKGYTIGDPLSPSAKGTAWRLDDEKLVYPFYERARQSGLNRIICIHKGLLPRDYEKSWPGVWKHATVDDLPKAAKDNPDFAFIMYHGALRIFLEDPAHDLAKFEQTGRIDWVTDLARMRDQNGLTNVYGELGTTFATCAVTNPRMAAAVVGSLVNGLGADHVVWGTDSVWYGSPQWQIEAFRRLEIPEDMMKKMGWKIRLGDADSKVKRMIFGENSARLYNYQVTADVMDKMSHDKLAQMKDEYNREGVERNNTYYGYIGKKSETA